MNISKILQNTSSPMLITACVLVTGCATKYAPPPGSQTAELRITADQFYGLTGGGIRAVYYREGSCSKPEVMAVISKIHTSKSDSTTTLPQPPASIDTTVDRVIETSSPINMTLFSANPGYGCTLPIAFNVEPNKTYHLRFYWDWTQMTCQADLASLNKISREEPSKIRITKQANDCKTGMNLPAF